MQLESITGATTTFVTEVELWTPRDATSWDRAILDRSGLRAESASIRGSLRVGHRVVARSLASGRAEVATTDDRESNLSVELAIPYYGASKLEAILVLRSPVDSRRVGCIEIWEPSSVDELSHAEGYYGALSDFELSSRLARFRFGSGLPGLAWEKRRPHLILDVRSSPSFLRSTLALAHGLALGLAIPVTRGRDVAQVVTMISSAASPIASAVEVWIPDSGNRLWLEDGAYAAGHAAMLRAMKITCFMSGEGIVGRAFSSQRPLMWSKRQSNAREVDPEARSGPFEQIVAIPTFDAGKVRSVLVLRS